MPEEYDAAEAWLKLLKESPESRKYQLSKDDPKDIPIDPYGNKKRGTVGEWLKEQDADFEAVVAKGKRYGLDREAVKNLPKWIMKEELRQAEQNRLHGQMEQPLESGYFDIVPYLTDEQAKAQGVSPNQAHGLNAAAFIANLSMPITSVSGLAKAQKFATKYGRKLYEMPQLDAIDSEILTIVARQNLTHANIPEALALQKLLRGGVPNVPLRHRRRYSKPKDPNVVTKGQQGWINRPIKSGSGISQAEIEGQRLVPQGKSSFEGKSSIEDEVDTLLQMREALAKEGMPRDWVVNPTKGMYRDTPSGKASFEKMYSMPRIKGKTLGQTDFSKMSKQDRHSLFQQLDDAVNSMHRQGIGHGDLHSGNILISYEKNKPKLTIIDPWPSKDPVYSIGRDHTYLTEHKMQILYPEIGGAPTKLTGKQRDIYMKKLGVNLEDLENYEKLFRYQEKFQGKKTKAIGKQRIKDLTEGNVPPPMRDLKWKEPL